MTFMKRGRCLGEEKAHAVCLSAACHTIVVTVMEAERTHTYMDTCYCFFYMFFEKHSCLFMSDLMQDSHAQQGKQMS